MTLTLVLRQDKKGRYWLTRYTGENAPSTVRATVQIEQELADLLVACVESAVTDGQLHLWA